MIYIFHQQARTRITYARCNVHVIKANQVSTRGTTVPYMQPEGFSQASPERLSWKYPYGNLGTGFAEVFIIVFLIWDEGTISSTVQYKLTLGFGTRQTNSSVLLYDSQVCLGRYVQFWDMFYEENYHSHSTRYILQSLQMLLERIHV